MLVRIFADIAEAWIDAMTPTKWSARISGFCMGFVWMMLAGIVWARWQFGGW